MPDYREYNFNMAHTSATIAPATKGTPTFWSSSFEPLPDQAEYSEADDAKDAAETKNAGPEASRP